MNKGRLNMNMMNANDKMFKNGKNSKVRRVFIGALTLLLITGALSGCAEVPTGNNETYTYSDNSSHATTTTEYNNEYPSETESSFDNSIEESDTTDKKDDVETRNDYSPNVYKNDELDVILSKKISITSADSDDLINAIRSIQVYYPNSELFNWDEVISKYDSLNDYQSNTPSIFINGKITSEQLFNIVHTNNANANFKEDRQISDADLKKVCDVLTDTINYYISNNNVDINLLSEKIGSLKIQNYTEFSNGAYGPTDNMMTYAVQKITKTDRFFKMTVEHECAHLIQSASKQELNTLDIELRFGPCYKFKDTKINSLYWNWFFEGTAEYLTLDLNNTKENNVYPEQIKAIDSVKVATIIDSNKRVDSFERLSFDKNIESVFEFFNCKTDSDKRELLNMMASFDVVYGTGEISKDFTKLYESTMSVIDGSTGRRIKAELKGSIAQTLTKQFYENMIKEYSNKEVSLKELFSLISIFENEMSRFTWYSSTGDKEQLLDFVDHYNEIQGLVFETISKKTGIDTSDLLDMYTSFNANYNIQTNDLSVNEKSKEFYDYILDTRKNDKTGSIYDVSQRKYSELRSGSR